MSAENANTLYHLISLARTPDEIINIATTYNNAGVNYNRWASNAYSTASASATSSTDETNTNV